MIQSLTKDQLSQVKGGTDPQPQLGPEFEEVIIEDEEGDN